MNSSELFYFVSFILFIVVMLVLDLGLLNKHDHIIKYKEALLWSLLWMSLAFGFYLFVLFFGEKIHGIENLSQLKETLAKYKQAVVINDNFEQSIRHYKETLSFEFLTGYIIEEALSVDNIFVIILIFAAFGVDKRLYHRVLFWGILGAIVFRCVFIFTGAILVAKFEWILYLFSVFLIYSGVKMFLTRNKKEEINTVNHPVVKFASKYFAVHPKFEGNKFFVKIKHKRYLTPLLLVLFIIEFSDILFAVDSIPAIFAVTKDPYIIIFSNIFAVLGLRSMFFLLINVIDKFQYFKHGLSVLLAFIGLKMLFNDYLKGIGFTVMHSLGVIIFILSVSIIFSLFNKKENVTP